MSDNIAIKVENLSKCYQIYDQPRDRLKQFVLPRVQQLIGRPQRQYHRDFWALKDVSFEVKKGESVGIIGRNGSGKSTLLQIITGTLSPTSGSATTNGRIAALLELGSGFNPEFTGRENVYLNGALLGFSSAQIEQKFDAIAAFADIGEHLDQPIKTYSSGMLVRLAFAVQVQIEPDILIVDEALAVGDALFQKRCYQKIEKLISRGTTLLFVSHEQESVRTLTNNSILLNNGKIVSQGLSSDVIRDYRKILHKEEASYLSRDRTGGLSENFDKNCSVDGLISELPKRSDQLSFGDMDGVIHGVKVFGVATDGVAHFTTGDKMTIEVDFSLVRPMKGLNVGVMLRNKEGVKIYAWGTLNQDISILSGHSSGEVFWEKTISSNEVVRVIFESECHLGENLYEIQVALMQFDSPSYELSSSRVICWRDEAAFVRVAVDRQRNFFGGICDMQMTAKRVLI